MNFLQRIWALEPIRCRRLQLTSILNGTVPNGVFPTLTTPDISITHFGDYDANTIPGVED